MAQTSCNIRKIRILLLNSFFAVRFMFNIDFIILKPNQLDIE